MASTKPAAKKTTCPVTPSEFSEHAPFLKVQIGDTTFEMDPRQFSTGSLGWNGNQKMVVVINGKRCVCQIGLNVTLVGSKPS